MSRNHWSSRISFIITTAAFAVGLGNVWRFPYITGANGGGAFLLVYLILIFIIGIPLLTIEISLGRMSETTPLIGFGKLSSKSKWNGIGWLGVITNIVIMSFYVMILAWIIIYFGESLLGNMTLLNPRDFPEHFNSITSNLGTIFLIILCMMVAASFVLSRGLQGGLERYTKWMMMALVAMMLSLAIWASTLEGAAEGYRWYLTPDFSKINLQVILTALGQVFFSVGVGMAIAFSFGSYTDKKENLISSTVWIVLVDTFFAVLAGLMMFPAIFSFGLEPDSGPNLIFVTMASIFGQLEYGQWVGAIFFLLLFLGGFTSFIASVQGLKDSFQDKYNLSSFRSLLLVLVIISLGSIPVVYSYVENPVRFFGMTTFSLLDYVANVILLPISGLLIAVFGAYVIGFERLKTHLELGAGKMKYSNIWKFIIQWIIPITLLIILLNGFM